MNASFANDPKIARKLGEPDDRPAPAPTRRTRGPTAGDSRAGRERHGLARRSPVELRDDVPRGRRLRAEGPLAPAGGWANVNALVAGRARRDMGESTCVHATEITVSRI